MALMARGLDAYAASVLQHFPQGDAWPREPGTALHRLAQLFGGELAHVDQRVLDMVTEADPRRAAELLEEWEAELGLPDECSAGVTLLEARRAAVVARLTELRSPTPAAFVSLAATLGVDASIIEHRAHTTEHDTEGAITDEPWAYVWDMLAPEILRLELTTEDDTETPLEVWPVGAHECAVRRMAPAHTLVRFGTYKAEWDFAGSLPVGATLRRASPGAHTDYRGRLVGEVADVARFDYDDARTYNVVPNPWGDGGVIGGALPTDWSWSGAGLTSKMLAKGMLADGTQHVEIELSGTATAANNVSALFVPIGPGAPVPINLGDDYSFEVGVEVLALSSSLGNPLVVRPYVGGASTFPNAGLTTGAPVPLGAPHARYRATDSMDNAASYCATCGLLLQGHTIGDVVLVKVRISFPIMSPGTGVYLTDTVPVARLAERINGVPQYGLQGVLIEDAATNLLPNSQGFVGTTLSNLTVTDAAAPAPTGALVASLLDEGVTGVVAHTSVWENFATTAGAFYTASCFFQDVSRRFVQLSFGSAQFGTGQRANFDLVAGALGSVSGGAAAIEPYPGGWYRCSFTVAATGTGSGSAYCALIPTATASRSNTYAGTGLQLRAWGRMVEEGPGTSSFVATAGAAATRAEDQLHIAVPDGNYDVALTCGTADPAGTVYSASATAVLGEGLRVVLPPAAIAAGERHLKSLSLRRTA
ncbi:DUF2313 domain-containing protein [Roseomonas terrae]|uniref:DUF2313 domain-containing protein n=1 Tax=Neoroseomonas terrae TaxID=424799 RepID=A0ABS5EQJ9_9PROT|nr:putative phage tail protein [Neoroseomonas terrae]MBR0653306.1 DUF2313 domain-containing protein [Neoroseomonas terrae]